MHDGRMACRGKLRAGRQSRNEKPLEEKDRKMKSKIKWKKRRNMSEMNEGKLS